MAAYRFAAFKRGFIMRPGPGLDPLVFGVVLAAIEKFRPHWWQRLINCPPWLWVPAIGLIVYALYLGETKNLTVSACVWQFPLIAIGMAGLLVLRGESPAPALSSGDSRRSVHSQHCLQRLPDSEARH